VSVRIGLTQRLEWLADRGEMRQALDVAWNERLFALGAEPVALPMRGVNGADLLQRYRVEVLLLTGGNEARAEQADPASRERNTLESDLLRAAQAAGTPVLGVCHGLQIMNVFLGGKLAPVRGHVRSRHVLPIFGAVNSFHDVAIPRDDLAPALAAVASAEDGTVEAAVHRSLDWLGVMWHPERAMPDGEDGMASLKAFLGGPAAYCRKLREAA
jgi:gamma-glutamyl-gamma-aminobutyrate hydrolase PuuD